MHDEVSETENIRKNLAIERMIVEGCEVLLDTSQTFVRQGQKTLMDCGFNPAYSDNPTHYLQNECLNCFMLWWHLFKTFSITAYFLSLVVSGSLIQVPMSEKGKITRGRLGSLSLKKEGERQCFLFSKHLIICTRGSGGKLHLTKVQVAVLFLDESRRIVVFLGGPVVIPFDASSLTLT